MSGHSKWNNIKGRKEKSDAQRAKIFTMMGRQIMVAMAHGTDPDSNPSLKNAIQKANQNNMPNDKIKAILDRGNNQDMSNFSEITYEGYGVGGVAVIVKCLTDNKNRTSSDVRYAFDKFGGSMGATGCVSYMFENKGIIILEKTDSFDSDNAMELALEIDAIDCEDDEVFTVFVEPNADAVEKASNCFTEKGYSVLSAGVELVPQNYTTLTESQKETFEKMVNKLEDSDDVQEVIHNLSEE
ncbi:MAG: YebC/PmpR family DNA-binding transcriptional regulator [Clostridia bacterium]|nr:YebC/PmpR family DNA-binding transcriptional regulator [Clostridia bacterium]